MKDRALSALRENAVRSVAYPKEQHARSRVFTFNERLVQRHHSGSRKDWVFESLVAPFGRLAIICLVEAPA